MNYRDEITEIFYCMDDFCEEFSKEIAQARQFSDDKKYRSRAGQQ